MSRITLVYRNGKFVEKHKAVSRGLVVMPDIQPFTVPGYKGEITSRSSKRDFISRNDLVELGNDRIPPKVHTNERALDQAVGRALAQAGIHD